MIKRDGITHNEQGFIITGLGQSTREIRGRVQFE